MLPETFLFSPFSLKVNLCKETYKFICENALPKPKLVVPQLFDANIFLRPSTSNLEGHDHHLLVIPAILFFYYDFLMDIFKIDWMYNRFLAT